MTVTPHLAPLDALVAEVAAGTTTPEEALAILRARGCTPNREALADAVAAMQLRDRYAGRFGDPIRDLGIVVSPFVNPFEAAVDICEDWLQGHLRRLVVRAP